MDSRAVSRNVERQGRMATPFLALELIFVFRRALSISEFKDKKRSVDSARTLEFAIAQKAGSTWQTTLKSVD